MAVAYTNIGASPKLNDAIAPENRPKDNAMEYDRAGKCRT
jgi:hypothetical protein